MLVYSCEKRSKQANTCRTKQKPIEKDEFTFIIGEGIHKSGIFQADSEFDDINRCLDFILAKLLDHFPVRRILKYFKEFVRNEFSKHTRLPPLLKQIYLMDMGRRKKLAKTDLSMLNTDELDSPKKEELAEALNSGQLCFIEGIPFLSY